MARSQPGEVALATGRSSSLSHGEEVDRIHRGREAAHLSYLTSGTALLFRALARGRDARQLQGLVRRSNELVDTLRGILENQGRGSRDLPYRLLVPLRVWEMTLRADTQLSGLAERVPDVLARALSGESSRDELTDNADLLQTAARRLQAVATEALHSQPH